MILTDSTLNVVTEYLIGGAQRCQPWALSMILQALGAVVYENIGLLGKVQANLKVEILTRERFEI